eukprot:Hpha_TRINITY_DN16613_c2_g3::TRINITY_DN16613_c2_g3_i1::g.181261::m.181261/K18442/ARFGEF, BIG; brefeldin A-inhibited guanine nucleotide-exchange protein
MANHPEDLSPVRAERVPSELADVSESDIDSLYDGAVAAEARLSFIVRALKRIWAICGTSRKWTYVREACTYACSQLQEAGAAEGKAERVMSLCFVPLRLAIESKQSKLMEVALDCLQKLFAHGCITGDMIWVQPHITNAEPLWMRNVREWAKQTKEKEEAGGEVRPGEFRLLIHHCIESASYAALFQHDGVQLQVIKAMLSAVSTPSCGCHGGALSIAVRTVFNIYIMTTNPINSTTAKGTLNQMISIVFQRMAESSGLRISPGSTPRAVSPSGAGRSPFRTPLTPPQAAPGETSPRRRSAPPSTSSPPEPDERTPGTATAFAQAAHEGDVAMGPRQHDAYTIFRSLCKLSAREISDTAPPESTERKSKLLSLELLLAIVVHSGDVFRTSDIFMQAVKQNLCLSLLNNCISSMAPVFRLSLHIFLALIKSFKDHLKREIGLFFTNVLLVIVESPNAAFPQKILVIQVLHRVCENPQTIIDIFVNYDCDIHGVNIFELMVSNLSRIVQIRHTVDVPRQESDMKLLALRVLVMILRSMIQWTEEKSSYDQPQLSPRKAGRVESRESQPAAEGELGGGVGGATDEKEDSVGILPGPAEEETHDDDFEQRKQKKKNLEQLLRVFQKSAKEGLKLVWAQGLAEKNEKSTAQWLKDTPGLDKQQVGEYLSRSGDFEKQVLNEFVELFDFTGMEIDEAIRMFLSKFKICGEAQVIDRTMEKFAEQYTLSNQDKFPNASTAFILAFSIIMLNTDAHSESIKEKMTQKQFLANNRGIDDGKNVDPEVLTAIYDRVTSKPFTLEGEAKSSKKEILKSTGAGARFVSDGKKRAKGYEEEMRTALQNTRELFQRGDRPGAEYRAASKREHVKPMFAVAWSALLPAFSVLLEQSAPDQQNVIDLCLEGFLRAIHLSCIFYLDTERDAFVSALSKLTFLDNYRAIEGKNIRSIRMLIHIATTEGNYLRSSWFPILRCISQLDKAQMLATTAKPDFHFLKEEDPSPRQAEDKLRHFEQANSQTIAEAIDEAAISRIFASSSDLSNDAIVDFVHSLCQVSTEEIVQSSNPRMFSLQKLIEVADANMGRIRYVWSNLCRILSPHFIQVGTNPSLHVSMYGIDSLKQLASKFLAKKELTGYTFQRDFLKPFALIIEQSSLIEIRELIVRCLAQMVHREAPNIRSGWHSIFSVLQGAASDTHEGIVSLAFDVLQKIQETCLPLVIASEAFMDMLNAATAFATNRVATPKAANACRLLEELTPILLTGTPPDSSTPDEPHKLVYSPPLPPEGKILSDDKHRLDYWFRVLHGLCAAATQQTDLEVRKAGVQSLFQVLETHGGVFGADVWKLVLSGDVRPVFDNAVCDLSLRIQDASAHTAAEVLIEDALKRLHAVQQTHFVDVRAHFGDVLGFAVQCCKVPAPASVPLAGRRALAAIILSHCDCATDADRERLAPGYRRPDTPQGLSATEWEAVATRFGGLLKGMFPQVRELRCDKGALVTPEDGSTAPTPAAGGAPEERIVALQHHREHRTRGGSFARKASANIAAVMRKGRHREAATASSREDRVLGESVLLLRMGQLQEHLPTHCGVVSVIAPALDTQCLSELLLAPSAVHEAAAACCGDASWLETICKGGAHALFASVVAVECRALRLQLAGLLEYYLPYQWRAEEDYPQQQQERRKSDETREAVARILMPTFIELFSRYSGAAEAARECRRSHHELLDYRRSALAGVLVYGVDSLTSMHDQEFTANLAEIYPRMLGLLTSAGNEEKLQAAMARFLGRVGRLHLSLDIAVLPVVAPNPLAEPPSLVIAPVETERQVQSPTKQPPPLFSQRRRTHDSGMSPGVSPAASGPGSPEGEGEQYKATSPREVKVDINPEAE